MKLKDLSTDFEYFTPKMTNFFNHSALNHNLYLHLIYELLLCKNVYQYMKYMDTTNIFPLRFFHRILTILPKK